MSASLSASPQEFSGADGAKIKYSIVDDALQIDYHVPPPVAPEWTRTVFIALDLGGSNGSAVLPFEENTEGSTVFLPFRADKFYAIQSGTEAAREWRRRWEDWKWSDRVNTSEELVLQFDAYDSMVQFPLDELGDSGRIKLVVYSKEFANNGWGRLFGCSDPAVEAGAGDKYIPHYYEIDLKGDAAPRVTRKGRLGAERERMRIYQLFVRLFSNTNETRKPNGSLSENGVGKFSDINDRALKSLRELGFTHLWLTGVLQQATGTDYSNIGHPADDPDLLKGLAGSPYAIKDYFDVSPDYAEKPSKRIAEFKALLERIHQNKLKALIDLVPNHVARSYGSDVKPELDFGRDDDRSKPFHPQNNFFYLQPDGKGPPLRLPTGGTTAVSSENITGRDGARPSSDGVFEPERVVGRVTGNNKVSWQPDINDWYETVKLNYGFDFSAPGKDVREYPTTHAPGKPIPDTWKKMDSVIEYWQSLGVDGFRCDMAHMEPPEFWHWAIAQARARRPEVVFIAEAYDNDPAKVPGSDPIVSKLNGGKSNVMVDLLNAGFNAVYDDPTYKVLKKIYDGPGWANDIDDARSDDSIFDNSLRYAENHDEVRLAAPKQWGDVGMKIGPAISAILYGLSRGPVMLYNGQEVGEPGADSEGFGSDDSRTSIFDYWSMPEVVTWVNGHKYDGVKLSAEQKNLRAAYGRLLKVVGEPAFRDGNFFPLNATNKTNPKYGRVDGELHSGHWFYSFLRSEITSGQRFLVVVNLNPNETLKDVAVLFGKAGVEFLDLNSSDPEAPLIFTDRLTDTEPATATSCISEVSESGVWIGDIPPHTARYFEIKL